MLKKEEYKQKDGSYIFVVSKRGVPLHRACFIASAEDEKNIDSKDWLIPAIRENMYPHLAYQTFHRNIFPEVDPTKSILDHGNLCKYDNVRSNLQPKTRIQNSQNVFRRHYINNGKDFRTKLKVDTSKLSQELISCPFVDYIKGDYIIGVSCTNEADVCRTTRVIESLYQRCDADYNVFDIVNYRVDDFNTLLLERTGKITKEEADLRHIMSYSNNAWYLLQYGLEDIYKENNIKMPEYSLDENGFLTDKNGITRLCPNRCNTRQGLIKYSSSYVNLKVEEQLSTEVYSNYLNLLNITKKHYIVGNTTRIVDEDLLYSELQHNLSDYKDYTLRAALDFTKTDILKVNDSIDKVMLDGVLTQLQNDTVFSAREKTISTKEEERAVLSFFKSFCHVVFDTEQFLAEYSFNVTGREKVGYCHRAAVTSVVENYINIFRLDKFDLFKRYYRSTDEYLIYKDFYGTALLIENLWKSFQVVKQGDSVFKITDSVSNISRLIEQSAVPACNLIKCCDRKPTVIIKEGMSSSSYEKYSSVPYSE